MRKSCGGKSFFSVLLLLAYPGCANLIFGQELQFRNLNIDKGLSQNMITAICQDYRGYMWFGTKDGLNRYDGYTFKIYKADTYDSSAIRDNHITAIYEDEFRNLWIGSLYGGLQLYSRDQDNFIKIEEKNFPQEAKYISSITGNAKSGLVISFLSGHIVVINAVTDEKITNTTIFFRGIPIIQEKEELQIPVKAILAPDGLLWVSGKKGYKTYDLSKKAEVAPYRAYPTYVQEYRNNTPAGRHRDDSLSPFLTSVQDLQWDDDGVFWMNSYEGLYEFDPKRKEFVLYRFSGKLYSFLPIQKSGAEKLILVDSYDDKLLGFNPSTGMVKKIGLNGAYEKEMTDVRFSAMKSSRDGNIWLGSNGRGLFFSHPYLSLFEKGGAHADDGKMASSSLYAVLQRKSADSGGEQILFSTLNSFGQLDISPGGKIAAYNSFDLRTRVLTEDRHGAIWLGSPMGLVKYNPESHSEELKVPLNDSMIMSILTDSSGIVWFSTFSTLFSFDPAGSILKKFPFLPESVDRMLTVNYSTIHPDTDGSLWIGTAGGLFRFLPGEEKYTNVYKNDAKNLQSLSSNEVKSIRADPRQPEKYLWVGTPTGLNKLNKTKGTFEHFTTKDGLPNNTIYGILDDEEGNLWLSTNRGLSLFNTRTFVNFDVDNGLQSNEFNTGSYFKSRDGELFFGGINGYNRFHPAKITTPQQAIPVVISKAELVGTVRGPLFSEITDNVLRYDQNTVSITLASLDYIASDKITYAYRIVNRDTSWITIGRNRNILLTNLSPGNYVFQGKGTDGLGRWNDQMVEMTLIISPPWWRTNLAYLVYATTFLAFLYLFWRRYKNRLILRQNLETERKQAQAILELDRVKSRFLANITHEFRTPLTLINGHLEQLKDDASEIAAETRYKEMEQNSHQLLELINQLMDLSKIESGGYKLRYKTKDLVQEMKAIVSNFSHYARQKELQLKFEIDPSSDIRIAIRKIAYDESVVRTITSNLLSNACKFTPRRGVIQVTLAFQPLSGVIQIVVSDSGVGIPKEELNWIFDRFYQPDNSAGRHYGGSGIGLSLVKELTALHGGSVRVESEVGKGSRFTVILKEGTAGSGSAAVETALTGTEQIATPARENDDELPTILIAEDHKELRHFIRDSLGKDYRYMEAAGGVEAFKTATSQIPDLIISDVMMPEMDGLELCEKIKSGDATSHIPFILLTARADQEDKMAGLQNGADDYLTKPFSVSELRIRIENILRSRKIIQERYQSSLSHAWDENSKENAYLQKAEEAIRNNISDYMFSVERLAELMSLSTAQLNRKIKAITGQPTVTLIQNVRMQMALELLGRGEKNIAEIGYAVGFESPGYFGKVFKKHYGFTPSEREKLKDYLQTEHKAPRNSAKK